MSTPQQPTEEELQAFEAQLKQVRVEDVVVQSLVSLVNIGGRKAGLAPGTEDERDPGQLHMAIEAARALLPLVEQELGPDAAQVRNALSQLQMAYAQGAEAGGAAAGPAAGAPGQPQPQQPEPGPAPSSGRLWVPGQ